MPERTLDIVICGLEEIAGCFDARMTHAISILDPETEEPAGMATAGLAALPGDNVLRLRFHDVIDHAPAVSPPGNGHIAAILKFGTALKAHGAPRLLIHCHAGISRSTAAAIIVLAQLGAEAAAAVDRVVALRPIAWPNLRMIEIGDRMLKLEQRLVRAVRRHHAQALSRRPELKEIYTLHGRAREVEGLDAFELAKS
ncbi:MAG: tyrosine phosphatase family protein [Alphaproteobacteria bacterium]